MKKAHKKLKKWRASQELSQASLGFLLGCSGDLVGKIERGDRKPGRMLAYKISQITKISILEWGVK